MTRKVDRTRSPPFRLVLGWVFNLLLILHFWHALAPARRHLGRSGGWALSFVFLFCIQVIVVWPLLSRRNGSLSSSPPFRLALAWSPLLRWLPLWVPVAYSKSSSPPLRLALALHLPTQLTTTEVGPGLGTFFSSFTISPTLLSPLWPPPPAGIQSDSDPKWSSSCFFSAGCCHGTVQSDLLYPSLMKGRVSLVRSPSTLPVLVVLALEPPFSSSYLMLLFTTLSPLQIDEMAVIFWRWICMVPSMCCPFSQDFLGRILHALEMFSLCPLYGSYWLRLWLLSFWTPFSTKVWLGLTICWRRTSERNLSVGSLHALVPCFTRFHQAMGWSSCLALSNQQACVRPYCFTGRPRPLGTSFSTGSMVPFPWSAPSSIEIPALRVPRYRLAPVDCFLSSSVTGKAPC